MILPPSDAIEVQPFREQVFTGHGSIAAQSQILVKYEFEIAWISLSRGLWTIIDIEDIWKVSGVKWCAYTKRTKTYALGSRPKRYVHRVILQQFDPKILIDHQNENGLDNRKNNLRLCSNSDNLCNRGKTAVNTTGFKGVTRHKDRFRAKIKYHGVNYHLGLFNTPEEAYAAYCKAASEIHKEFANFS